jgi:homoserine acetyltransferase
MSQVVAPFPEVEHQQAVFADGLPLDCGAVVAPLTVAFRTYGTLNAAPGPTRCWSATRSPATSTWPSRIP